MVNLTKLRPVKSSQSWLADADEERRRSFTVGQKIAVRPGLYYVANRVVRLVSDEDPDGLISLVSGPFTVCEGMSAIAHTETEVCWFYMDQLSPSNHRLMMDGLQLRFQWEQRCRLALASSKTETRIFNYLRVLVTEYGRESGNLMVLPFVVTHGQIAQLVHSTRVTVTRNLGALRMLCKVQYVNGDKLALSKNDLL